MASTVALTVLAVALVPIVLGFGPPTRDQLMEEAGLTGKQRLDIGVKHDQPGIALSTPGGWEGFDIDIAYMVAGYLGFSPRQVRLLPIESEDRARRQARDGEEVVTVDLVIASYSITEERERDEGASFSASYLHTEQSVITLDTDKRPVSKLEDLRDRKVCTLNTSTSEAQLVKAGAKAYGRNTISECVKLLYAGEVDAVTTDAAILAGFVTHSRDRSAFPMDHMDLGNVRPLRHWDIGSSAQERWGINTGPNKALRDLVDLALHASAKDDKDRVWEKAYDRNLRRQQKLNLPQPVAEAQQPDPKEVEVRQWPWERFALPLPGPPPPPPATVSARAGRRERARRSSGC